MIEYNDKNYKTGSVVVMTEGAGRLSFAANAPNALPLYCTFKLVNHREGEAISWEVETPNGKAMPMQPPVVSSNYLTDPLLTLAWPRDEQTLVLLARSGDRTSRITLKRPNWYVNQLQAIDADNKARVAQAGQTLYLVKGRGVDERAAVRWRSNLSGSQVRDSYYEDGQQTGGSGFSNTSKLYWYSRSPSQHTYRLNALGYDQTVKVELVDHYKHKEQVVPTKLQNSLEELFKGLTSINDLKKKLDPKGKTLEIKPKLSISGSQFNENHKPSRFYVEVRDGGIDAGLGVKFKADLPPPYSFGVDVPYIGTLAKVGGFVDFDFDLAVSGSLRWEKTTNETEFKNINNSVAGKASGGVTFGVKAEVLPDIQEVNFETKAYGKVAITGDWKYNFTTDKAKSQIYIDPLVAGVSVKAKVMGKTVWDSKYEYTLFNKILLYETK